MNICYIIISYHLIVLKYCSRNIFFLNIIFLFIIILVWELFITVWNLHKMYIQYNVKVSMYVKVISLYIIFTLFICVHWSCQIHIYHIYYIYMCGLELPNFLCVIWPATDVIGYNQLLSKRMYVT